MCGITGFWSQDGRRWPRDVVVAMADALLHRGPDDAGYWQDDSAGVALGHRRLSILDLSPLGHQPMTSPTGRYVVALNGEIYNFQSLRADLEKCGAHFKGHSDTEVLLCAIERWGLLATLRRAVGMFAFALWDAQEQRLALARDRFGEKPLYYGWTGRTLLFGSELKALRRHPACPSDVDRGALALMLRYGYVPAPHAIYDGISKLQPGHVATVHADGRLESESFWSMEQTVSQGLAHPLLGGEDEIADALEAELRQAVRDQMIADVPLGAFLSGGIDSATIVSLMQAESTRPVRTFTIGFHEAAYDEGAHAKAVARHLGTDHTELYVTPSDARAVIPKLPTMYDEPFADSSQIPTFLVAELARRHVTVSLSGDGGDELFGGYNRYFLGQRLWRLFRMFPPTARRLAAAGALAIPPGAWDRLYHLAEPVVPRALRIGLPGDRIHKAASVLSAADADAMYRRLVSHWAAPSELVIGATEPPTFLSEARAPAGTDFVERMMYYDARSYLPDDILVKVDRAAMSVALESRAPFLDHRVAELAWRIPTGLKVRGGIGKRILRRVLYRHVPPALVERPKTGFGIPLDRWLRGDLRDWASALLDPVRLEREGYLRPEPIVRAWQDHLAGRRNAQYPLWNVLMFEAWLEAR